MRVTGFSAKFGHKILKIKILCETRLSDDYVNKNFLLFIGTY